MTANEEVESRADAIADELRSQILSGKYNPGERLPSERELSERFGVNRASAREALKKLESFGMVSIRRGGGARVLALDQAHLSALPHLLRADNLPRDLVAQWLDVHELVISGTARLAVQRASSAEIQEADGLLKTLCEPELPMEDYIAAVDVLTALVARASHNVVLRMVRDGLTATAKTRNDARMQTRPSRKVLLPGIRKLRQAMKARDADEAEKTVRGLFAATREALLDHICGPEPRH